jgi:peroxiredoxin
MQRSRIRHPAQAGKEQGMSVVVGATAPDFTLPNQDREPVTLSEQLKKGPVVLAFMPAAFSGTCTTEMCTFRDSASELNKVNAAVIGVTVDTFFALKAWADAQGLKFPLLSDFNKDVIRKYGVVNRDMIGLKDISKRATFVIDRSGVVRHAEVLEDARNEPNYGQVKQALAGL